LKWIWRWAGWRRRTIRTRMHQRQRRGRPQYRTHGPLAHPWGHWWLISIEHGTGGPYCYDYFSWRRSLLPLLRRDVETRWYSVDWEDESHALPVQPHPTTHKEIAV
jgi:hypothetical protein